MSDFFQSNANDTAFVFAGNSLKSIVHFGWNFNVNGADLAIDHFSQLIALRVSLFPVLHEKLVGALSHL